MKVKFLYFLYAIKAIMLRCRGWQIGRKSFISGFPRFHKCKGSEIILGDYVTLHSKYKYNTLISTPMDISTVEPGAKLIFHNHCGLSGCKIVCATEISIGEYTIVGPDTLIYDRKPHRYAPDTGWSKNNHEGKPIHIGKRCYIGTRCIILKGVTIGDDCVIAAGTLITEDVPSGHLAKGNPACYTPLPDRLVNKSDWSK